MSRILRVGMKASKKLRITPEGVKKFADIIEDHNPIHLSDAAAQNVGFPCCISHGMYPASLFSGLMATEMPGPNTVYLSQELNFRAPMLVGDVIEVCVELTKFRKGKGLMVMNTVVKKADPNTKAEIVCIEGKAVGVNKDVTFEGDSPAWSR
ncbi:3-hydroxyacyl-ACP dehydratase [Strigomonas culicis]|uniref:3-hydroxyacyl-ACP dehydratase n=1 Tax=Strigomonas culicis TaxID=28005 RepID=S9UDK1_9TRYP|nr:3-hydroxyacyl-ACP dehydratase [Strigomonas culicis]|eukprot:EPY28902.1 3-hydroxyacyl-ACP dehydratase [Strigomonas culicis]